MWAVSGRIQSTVEHSERTVKRSGAHVAVRSKAGWVPWYFANSSVLRCLAFSQVQMYHLHDPLAALLLLHLQMFYLGWATAIADLGNGSMPLGAHLEYQVRARGAKCLAYPGPPVCAWRWGRRTVLACRCSLRHRLRAVAAAHPNRFDAQSCEPG